MRRKRAAPTELVYGRHPVAALFDADPLGVKELWVAEGLEEQRRTELLNLASTFGVPVQSVARAALDRLSDQGVHQGVIARYRSTIRGRSGAAGSVDEVLARCIDHAPLLLLLDGVEDPRNLGACLRSAAAAGVDAVIVPRSRGSNLSAEARKAAAGAAEVVTLLSVANLARTMSELSELGICLVGAAGEADTTLYDADLRGPAALVLGAEGRGLRRLTRERCDQLVAIPMASAMASLNVSVAAGVCLFEACRQRTSSIERASS